MVISKKNKIGLVYIKIIQNFNTNLEIDAFGVLSFTLDIKLKRKV